MERKKSFLLIFVCVLVVILLINYIEVSSKQKSISIRKLDSSNQTFFLDNNNKIVMNCFVICGPENIPCLLRHAQRQYQSIVFKGDRLACNFDYSNINKSFYNWNFSVWFYQDYQYLQENYLNFSLKKEQIIYSLNSGGEYKFIHAYLPNEEVGQQIAAPSFSIYAYDSTDEYDSKSSNINLNDLVFAVSLIGIIVSVLFIFSDDNLIKIDSEKYTIRVYKKKRRISRVHRS